MLQIKELEQRILHITNYYDHVTNRNLFVSVTFNGKGQKQVFYKYVVRFSAHIYKIVITIETKLCLPYRDVILNILSQISQFLFLCIEGGFSQMRSHMLMPSLVQ